MADFENREEILRRDGLLVGIVAVAALNGLPQSFYFLPALLLMEPFVKVTFFTTSPAIVNYLTALVLSTLTIMIAGIPAASPNGCASSRRATRPPTTSAGRRDPAGDAIPLQPREARGLIKAGRSPICYFSCLILSS